MLKFLQFARSLVAKGFASSAEKAQVAAMFKELSEEEQGVAKPEAEQVQNLQETDPKEAAKTEEEIEKGIKTLLKNASEEIKAEVKTWLAEQKEAMSKKAGIYNPEVQSKRKKQNEYLREFVKALYVSDISRLEEVSGLNRKELTTDATGTPYGGYIVDHELAAEIHHLTTQYGVARREMTTVQLSKHSYKANDLVTDVSVYWVDEAGAISSTGIVLGQGELQLKKLGAIVTLTREILEDGEIDLFSFCASRVAEKLASAEDTAFFAGDGTSTYGSFTGLLASDEVNEVTLASTKTGFDDVTADDLLDMQDATPSAALPNGKYFMHRTILSLVRKLKDDNKQYIYQRPAEGQPATIWDKPVVLVEAMPAKAATGAGKSFVLFGDLKLACIFGYKGAIAADRFNAGVVRNVAGDGDINLITSDREAVRWIERVGYLAILPKAVTKLTTAAT